MSQTSGIFSLGPYHIISYGILLGTQTFQSFIGGIVAFKVLPRPQFSTLQAAIFPIYFSLQSSLPVIMALTFPAERTALGTNPSSVLGVLEPSNRLRVLTPLATLFLAGLINATYIGPATTKCMRQRKHQETRDGKKSYDPPPHSKEMQELNKKFGILHGASSLVNMVSWAVTIWYGFYLADRLI